VIAPESQISPVTLRVALTQHAKEQEKIKSFALGDALIEWSADTAKMIWKPCGPPPPVIDVRFCVCVFFLSFFLKKKQ
jgi:hypothetical protein